MVRQIGIVGAPGSGKSKLAESLADKGTVILDNYIKEIEEETDLALGGSADYFGNLNVVLGRIARERVIKRDQNPDTLITCGTLIESSIYTAIDTVNRQGSENFLRIQNFMHILGVIYQDSFRYNPIFAIVSDEFEEGSLAGRINDMIVPALDSFGISYYLLKGTDEEKTAEAKRILGEASDKAGDESTEAE